MDELELTKNSSFLRSQWQLSRQEAWFDWHSLSNASGLVQTTSKCFFFDLLTSLFSSSKRLAAQSVSWSAFSNTGLDEWRRRCGQCLTSGWSERFVTGLNPASSSEEWIAVDRQRALQNFESSTMAGHWLTGVVIVSLVPTEQCEYKEHSLWFTFVAQYASSEPPAPFERERSDLMRWKCVLPWFAQQGCWCMRQEFWVMLMLFKSDLECFFNDFCLELAFVLKDKLTTWTPY